MKPDTSNPTLEMGESLKTKRDAFAILLTITKWLYVILLIGSILISPIPRKDGTMMSWEASILIYMFFPTLLLGSIMLLCKLVIRRLNKKISILVGPLMME